MVEDRDLALARQYVGVDANDYSRPGLVLLAPDRTVLLRQSGDAPGERIYAAELLRIVDGLRQDLGLQAASAGVSGGFNQLERVNLRVGGRLALAQDRGVGDGLGFSTGGVVAGLYPLSRHLMIGALARGLLVHGTRLDVDVAVRLRRPIQYDLGELYLQIPLGLSWDASGDDMAATERRGFNGGLAAGVQFAPWPGLAIYLELVGSYHRFPARAADDALVELRYAFGTGVSLLF